MAEGAVRVALGGVRRRMASPLGEFNPEVRRALGIDVSATLLLTAFTCLTAPFTGLILRRELGATPLQLAVAASAGAASLLLSLLWARAMTGRAPLACVVWSGFAARGLFLLVPFAGSAWPFVAVLAAGSILGHVAAPAQAALTERVYPRAERGRALGIVRTAGALPAIAMVAGAGGLLTLVDYRWLFAIAALFGMAASLRLRELPVPERPSPPGAEGAGLGNAWTAVRGDQAFRRLLVAFFLFGSGVWLQVPANPVMVADVLRATAGQVGVCAAFGTAAALIGNLYWGRLVDRRPSLGVLRGVYLVGLLVPLLYYVAWSPWALAGIAVAEALMQTGVDLVWMVALIDLAGPRRAAQYMAISATLTGVRGVMGPLVGALVIEVFGVHTVYLLAAGSMGVAAALVSRQLGEAPAAVPALAPQRVPTVTTVR